MAVYALSPSGIEALYKLQSDLSQIIKNIASCCDKLQNDINGLENDLGIYYNYILLEVKKVLLILKKVNGGEDGIYYLTNKKIPDTISEMLLMLEGFEENDGPQRKLVRKL